MIRKKLLLPVLVICLVTFGCGDEITPTNTNQTANTRRTPTPENVNMQPTNSVPTNAIFPANNVKNGNKSVGNVSTTPTPTFSQEDPKKEKGLFSFPPPRVTSFEVIDRKFLLSNKGPTTFSQVSRKLTETLEAKGYASPERYSFFGNNTDEFAIVTAMERIAPDGTPLEDGQGRWEVSEKLPPSRTENYLRDLFAGRKVFYRVWAFVVTSKRSGNSFKRGDPPEFSMAANWSEKGDVKLGGDGEPAAIQDVVFTENYKCYALLYLFVNHTSLDRPKSVDSENMTDLREGLELNAANQLKKSGLFAGGNN